MVEADEQAGAPAVVSGQEFDDAEDAQGTDAQTGDKPTLVYSRRPDHKDKDEHIDEGGACVTGDDEDQAAEIEQYAHQLGYRRHLAQILGVFEFHQHLRQQHGEKELDDLRRLNVEGDTGDGEPGSVAADVHAQGSAQEQDKEGASSHDPAPLSTRSWMLNWETTKYRTMPMHMAMACLMGMEWYSAFQRVAE